MEEAATVLQDRSAAIPGGMLILAVPAYLANEFFLPVFYLIGTAVVAKYTGEMYSKLKMLFGVNLLQKLP